MAAAAVVGGGEGDGLTDVPTRAYDRVVRIVSWIFLLATTTIVAVSGLWPENQALILVILALAGLFVLVVHDLLPAYALGPAKFVVEGSVAITVATLLVALTGGVESPFFFVFPLDRRWRRAGRLARDHGRAGGHRGARLPAGRVGRLAAGIAERRSRPRRSGSTSPR